MGTEPTTVNPATWAEGGLHLAQLPSGAYVRFRFPDLAMLVAADRVPDTLIGVALARIGKELKLLLEPTETMPEPTADREALTNATVLNYWLISEMVVEPKIDPEVVPLLPAEDVEMLAEFAERIRDTDARGVVMGVVPLSRFARFRDAHLCGADCEGCARLRAQGFPTGTVAM